MYLWKIKSFYLRIIFIIKNAFKMLEVEKENCVNKSLNVELVIIADKEKEKYIVNSKITSNSKRVGICICTIIGLLIIASVILILLFFFM
jgi:hypothetical protein